MALQVTIPDKDPLLTLLERRAIQRGFPSDKKKLRRKLAGVARSLIQERIGELEKNGDPFVVRAPLTT